MSQPKTFPAWCCFLLTLCVWPRWVDAAPEDVLSISEVNASKEKWNDWIDQPRKVEGRVSAVSRNQFRFVHCEVTFRVTEEQSRTVGNVRNVEVSGRFKKDKETNKLYFAVDRVKVLSSDTESYDSREARLKSTKSADWYALAQWAEARGKFYDDDELLAKARRAWTKGLQLERTNLPAEDADARLALADKLRDQKIDPGLQAELIHEAAGLKWKQARNDSNQRPQFLAWLKETYPESAEPLEKIPTELSRRYDTNPAETFRTADEATRKLLPRLLMIQVELATILPTAKADGSNASLLADQLHARVPERVDLIEKYRGEAFEWRKKSVTKGSRAEALRMADELKARDQADAAKVLLANWIRAQESRLRKDGPIGLMQLAEDYLQLAQDEPAAVKLLAEAHELDPSFEDAAERLKQLGYHLDQKRWVKGDAAVMPASPEKIPSQLAIGMTADGVLQLLGEPSGKSRLITGKSVAEVWSFGRRGTPRLLIHLRQEPGQHALKVSRFLTQN